jgi:hypothetical protein
MTTETKTPGQHPCWDKVNELMAAPATEYEAGYRKGMCDAALVALRHQGENKDPYRDYYNAGCADSFYAIIDAAHAMLPNASN